MAPDASQIGAALEKARTAARLSRPTVAERIGVDPQTVYRWEREGRKIPGPALSTMVAMYGISLEDIGISGDTLGVSVPRGTAGGDGRPDQSDEERWSPNPSLRTKIPKRAYDVALAYCRRLSGAGWPREEIEQIERLMIDPRYAQANKRKGVELSEDEFIMLIDATWEAVKHSAAALGRQV